MITLNMANKHKSAYIEDAHFTAENDVLTLRISLGDYDLTGKSVTAVFAPKNVETGLLSVVGGVIQLPVFASELVAGYNRIQLNIRWGDNKVEQSPIINWQIKESLRSFAPATENVTIVTDLILRLQSLIADVDALEGRQGIQGEVGPIGPQGEVGPIGRQGIQGEVGPIGPQGEVGPIGPQGIQGEVGPIGPQGIQGEVGPQGPQGIQGEVGPQGLQGEVGPAGYTPQKTVDYWTIGDIAEIDQHIGAKVTELVGDVSAALDAINGVIV